MRPTVLLVDIDGTLLLTGGAGRRAMVTAFMGLFGRDPCAFPFGGMTDRAIARGGLEELGATVDEAAIERVLAAYLVALEAEMVAAEVRFCEGMREALEAVERLPNVALGLGTGNVRAGARLKVSRITSFDRFRFGGFGCDHESRPELLRIGAERGAAALGLHLKACRVVVVGDTPKDVSAAQAIGAECVAVATGLFSVDALAACAPTAVFRHLGEPGAVAALTGEAG